MRHLDIREIGTLEESCVPLPALAGLILRGSGHATTGQLRNMDELSGEAVGCARGKASCTPFQLRAAELFTEWLA